MHPAKIVGSALRLAAALWLIYHCAAPASAQSTGRIDGEVLNIEGKPFPDVVVVFKNEHGQTFQTKTDQKGHFTQVGLPGDIYVLGFKLKDQVVYEMNLRLSSGGEEKVTVNFKEILGKQAEAIKKQEEEQKKFVTMKDHFDQGVLALNQAKLLRDQLGKAPVDQRAALQEKLETIGQTAITEFEEAQKAATEKDQNLHVVMGNLGSAYEVMGKFPEAATAFEKAAELKPTQANYYVGMGNALARQGKLAEANAACDKVSTIEPQNAATCWRNLGIVLYNTGKAKEAVEPLRKATRLDSKNAQAWYVLGASLVGAMDFKKEGSNYVPIMQPGTVEAYQKCIELDPNGPYGAQAKAGLEQLEAMGMGISTKMKPAKKKS